MQKAAPIFEIFPFCCNIMDEAEAVRELHENNIGPADYTTIESIVAFLEQQGCVFNVSYDKISE